MKSKSSQKTSYPETAVIRHPTTTAVRLSSASGKGAKN